ncbi:cobaltochelatase subunit CobN [Desulfobacca acetoxidans]|uniref:Magnesium chelatase n=1 Tax=Desulfobacca acetoxidans (strain ATCC 700848 / DSM 11109 / ASRB2) TaxID=880072 RepID=F2NEP7_DESAR|nr:cobaltochelatase subunit CobN [Desulfobacca acetoxidans]AEB08237.1 Magnesium chelatase [Desulfobacca acetoxidans DSM 11109]
MCRNEKAVEGRNPGLHTKVIFFLGCMLGWLFCSSGPAYAAKQKVTLLLTDAPTKTSIEAVKAIYLDYPNLKQQVEFHIYPSLRTGTRKNDLTPVSESKLIFIMLKGADLVKAVKPELEMAIKKGAKVYCVSGSYYDEHEEMGIKVDKQMLNYFSEGGLENMKNMILYALKKDCSFNVSFNPPIEYPHLGIYDSKTRKIFRDFEEYKKAYTAYRAGNPWIGVHFSKYNIGSGENKHLDAVIRNLEGAGFNVLPVYGSLAEAVEKFFCREIDSVNGPDSGKEGGQGNDRSRVRLVIALGIKHGWGVKPEATIPLLSRLNVPVVNAISLLGQSRKEWEKSPAGLDIFSRSFQIATPEIVGMIQPTIIASKERRIDKATGFEYIEEEPIPDRIERLTARVKAWVNLQDKPNKDKKIALVYYNYPPGKQNIGASYLNVLPESLWEILLRLKSEGYDLGGPGSGKQEKELRKEELFQEIQDYGRNISNWAPAEIDKLVKAGGKTVFPGKPQEGSSRGPVLIPLAIYKKWFAQLPESLQNSMIKSWGPVEQSNIMIWKDTDGKQYLVIPAVRYGNLLFTPQPARGWEQDIKKVFHDVTIPPHHQYVAFYLWLKHGFQADAVAHIGTHGTHEWLPGKEVGFTREDPPELLIQDLPNIYPYIVDNVGEGLQAKRRGMAVIIDYMTPPFDKAGLNKELKELASLFSDYGVAKEKSPPLAGTKLKEINELAKKMGLLTDLKLTEIKTEDEIEEVEHYLKDIAEKQTPMGLHTLGKSPEERYRKSTAEAILSIEKGLTEEERKKKLADLEDRINRSGPSEMDAFTAALSGQYIPAAQGNDPIRNPDSLPTGKNFYSFDPTRLPSPKIYEMGAKLARELIDGYQARHGQYPDKLSFVLWATETIRHEGVMESQIMYLLGIKPKWDERGRVVGVEAIPRKELGRPRIDVTMAPSGLYRDVFPNLMDLLDQAVTLAKQQDEADNLLRDNIRRTRQMLLEKGVALELAERLAAVRLFTTPPGAYGTNLDKAIVQSNSWDKDEQLADIYLRQMSHVYGQGFWGDKIENLDKNTRKAEDISLTLFKSALSGTKMAVHSRSSNLICTLDSDDFYGELGGMAMTIRALDGKTPETYVTNMSNPVSPKQETLEKVMGTEMRSRYLNPKWIKAMMKEGYAGARFVDKVIENLWGWQVTVPEAVDAAKWNEMYETYVLDKNGLDIKKMFKDAQNMWAYQSLVARMLETVRKGYWQPDQKVIDTLSKEYAESAKEVGMACCEHTCNNPMLSDFTSAVLMSVPGMETKAKEFKQALDAVKNIQQPSKALNSQASPNVTSPSADSQAKGAQKSPDDKTPPADSQAKPSQASPDAKSQKVEGLEVEEVNRGGFSATPIPYLFIAGFIVFLLLIRAGWRKKGDLRRR